MSSPILNLSRSPFLNRKAVERFCLLCWALGVVLIALNVSSYLRNRSDSTELRSRLRGLNDEISVVGEEVRGLETTIRELGPEEQNSRVRFLNRQIAARTFPWGELFDELGEILPRGVRLRNLNPDSGRKGRRGAEADAPGERRKVALSITGVARTETAIYELVDALFAHSHFSSPDLRNDRRLDDGTYSFVLNVGYRPAAGVSDEAGSESAVGGAS